MKKINGKVFIIFIFWLSVIGLLVYSRFINLSWSLPYPMHPDERNMANAIQQLSCKFSNLKECLNPHFFAYGQFPLYLGYLIVHYLKFFDGDLGSPIGFQEATISLRIISAVASIINAFVLLKIISLILNKKNNRLLIILIITFSPFFIQFSHFGTTESLLMLFYSLIVYFSIRLLEYRTTGLVVWLALFSGLSVATKVSSAIFLVVPVIVLLSHLRQDFPRRQGYRGQVGGQAKTSSKLKTLNFVLVFALFTLIFTLVFSPQSLINFKDFISSMNYESEVALGKSLVFYTRQFVGTIPVWFQLTKIIPYVLGWPVFFLGGLGLIGLSWKDKRINLLRFTILVYFIPNAFLYAKWSRFMAPIFPLILVLAIVFLLKMRVSKFIKIIIIIFAILPGIAYLSVYQNPDIRFQASEWIYRNIPNNSYILSETANVVDIPFSNGTMKQSNNYNVISFNFYNLDDSPKLQSELKDHLQKADYIFVPSRRIFANHPKDRYPLLSVYYDKLFSGKLGFQKLAEFSSGLNDEQAEETWTVFDHPVIRIYKKVKSF